MVLALLRPGRIVFLVLVAAIAVGGWWLWGRLHRSPEASLTAAIRSVKAAPSAAGIPAAGVYRMRLSGTEQIGIGPLTFDRSLPRQALLVVTGTSGGGREVELRLSADEAEAWRVDRTGRIGRARSLSVGVLGHTHAFAGAATPAVTLVAPKLRAGSRWHSTFVADQIAFDRTSRVRQVGHYVLGGVSFPAYEIEAKETATGALNGTTTTRGWFLPRLGLYSTLVMVRQYDGLITSQLHATLTLLSQNPA
jgi:hypothetical protein